MMKSYLLPDPWKIIEDHFDPDNNRVSESLFSIGNGSMGQRGNFEETYSGDTLNGHYIGGIYYPDKTRVGWWKNGYPEYFAKVLNAPSWIDLELMVNGQMVDLSDWEIRAFRRTLDMKAGTLEREVVISKPGQPTLKIESTRLCHYQHKELGLLRYLVKVEEGTAAISLKSLLNGDVKNEDANYGDRFWHKFKTGGNHSLQQLEATTKITGFTVQLTGGHLCTINGKARETNSTEEKELSTSSTWLADMQQGDSLVLHKWVGVHSTFNHPRETLSQKGLDDVEKWMQVGFDGLLQQHRDAWAHKWSESDIVIEGDVPAQQGIRFNIFQLHQTYSGDDPRLNIGPKGFTGEKYGGSTYWDTEAYCLPFYLSTASQKVGRNLLKYRFNHLGKAIENAEKLGFKDGAALYPMVTMNGEECHNEWEITFEEIHRNGAIAYAIFDYTRYTGDRSYLEEKGIQILAAICRFWKQRFHFSNPKQQFVMHGVTGPNEYENNVNNNWYTNYIARWCLNYTASVWRTLSSARQQQLELESGLDEAEIREWTELADQVYLPVIKDSNLIIQHEGFLDKEIRPASQIPRKEIPIHQHWSWDRILRSCYIKQADVLQGLYFFEDDFTAEQLEVNFDFYEPMTVHESSLSPCVHCILAARLGRYEKAFEMYLRTARLDLDNYNNDTEDGCHITSMAGTWMAVVKGFAGMRVVDNKLLFDPHCPDQWESYRFIIRFRENTLSLTVRKNTVEIGNQGPGLELIIGQKALQIDADGNHTHRYRR